MAPLTPKRICLTGPESTGKTTLAEQLSRELNVPWSAEYAREYAEARNNDLSAADVEPIARGEIALLDGAIARAVSTHASLVLHDTDLMSTVVYARHYYGACPRWIEEEALRRRADSYLLLDTDVAWIEDAARDSGGEARTALFRAFREVLEEFACNYNIISGEWKVRAARTREAVGTVAGAADVSA